MFSDTSNGDVNVPHNKPPNDQVIFIDHGNGAVSTIRRSLAKSSDRPAPAAFSPHVNKYPESPFDGPAISFPTIDRRQDGPQNDGANAINKRTNRQPPKENTNSVADHEKDRFESADNTGLESPPNRMGISDDNINFFNPMLSPPSSPSLSNSPSFDDAFSPHQPVMSNEPNYNSDYFPDDLVRINNPHSGGNTANPINFDSINEPLNNQVENDGILNEGPPSANRRRSQGRIRKQAPNYPHSPHSAPPNPNLFEPPVFGPGIGPGYGPTLNPNIGPNIGGEFIPGFQEPGTNSREPVLPFFEGPFIPGPVNPQLNPQSAPYNGENGFQRRRLTTNSVHDNTLGYGYPSYTYYKGEDEAATKWPKIFKFTDGRVNLSDFERSKKLGKIKFTKKNDYFDDIRRDSFLILHGGAYNY